MCIVRFQLRGRSGGAGGIVQVIDPFKTQAEHPGDIPPGLGQHQNGFELQGAEQALQQVFPL